MVDACFSYYWHMDENETEITSIRIYGLDRSNKNVCLRIDDFIPYIYIELPPTDSRNIKIDWGNNVQMVKNRLDDILKEHKPLRTKLVYKHKLYGAEVDKDGNKRTFPYLMCSFSNKNDYKHLSYKIKDINIFGIGRLKLKVHEYDASPILQFVSSRDIPTAGWLKFKGERVKNEEKLTLCDKEYIVSYKNIAKYEKDNVGKPKLMGFDIEVNSTNPSAMPVSTKQGDKIFQISCVFAREGSNESEYEPYLLSLGDPDPEIVGENTKVLKFDSEADLLEGFTKLVRTENPNIIVGYNILKFDIQYMIDRAKSPWTFNCFDSFAKMGFHKYNRASQEKIKWSSSAFKNQEFDFLNAEGRVFVDLLPLIQRDYKLNNYQLKTVSMEFLKDTKDDLSAKGIFKCYRLGIQKDEDGTYGKKARKAISVCGKYCIKDSVLVLKLMEKLQCWVGLCEMAKTTNIAIFDVFTQGQQRKVYSQLYKFCLYNNIVVEKDAYVTKENERYVGAHVFPPVPGNYERVLPFDFCFSGDTLITLSNGLSKRIDSFDKDCLLLGFNKDSDGFENYSFINGLQKKGIRDTVKVYFQDGSSIVATPEHKFMLENGEWCQAKDLKDKYVKSGIKFPEDKICELEKEWSLSVDGYNFSMKDDLEREKSLAFARMVGYILADGSIYETICKRGYTRKCVEACFGTLFDALTFKRDINLFSDIDVTIRKRDGNGDEDREKKGTTQCINLPSKISYMIHSLEDIMIGKRSTQEIKLPKFILDEKCPLSIVREFLGGLFGGDGTACCLSTKDVVNSISFKWTVIKNYINSMNNTFIQIKNLLEKLKVYNSSILKPIKINYTKQSIKPSDYLTNPRYDIQLRLILDSTIIFMKNIGFRYCINKQGKSYFTSMYLEMKEKTREQRIKVLDRTNELIDKNIDNVFSRKKSNMKFSDCLDIARKELLENEPALYPISLSSNYDLTYDRHERIRHPDKPRKYSLHKKKFPSPSVYFNDINVIEWFSIKKHLIKTDDIILPSFRQKVIDVREHIPTEVFDIEVDKVHNYLANGITVSNCSLYPTTIIAYNIDYSTIVNDSAVPDDKCNVMRWADHQACNHDPKVVRYNTLSKFIKDEEEEIKKLRKERDDKINKLFKQEYIDKINKKIFELKPYRDERSEIKKSIPKTIMCEEREYRFLKEPKGVIPTVLQNLLDARKNTRKEIKNNYKQIDSLKEKLKDNEENKEEIEKRIRELQDLNKVLDKRQLSYKVSANSMYGIMGVKKGLLPFMPGAMVTTFMGRTNIEKVANTIVTKYGGKLVYGDTDSNYVSFPHLKTAQESWDYAVKVAEEISEMFPKPISLAFEEAIYWQFFILTKKRYMYRACDRDGVIDKKIGKKGVLLARRDSAVLIRIVYEKVISMIFDKVPRDDILYYLLEELNRMCSNSVPYKDYIITKSVGDVNNMVPSEPYKDEKGKIKVNIGNYKVPCLPNDEKERQNELEKKEAENEKEYYEKCLPAVVQLAEKMRKRGQRVDVGTRLEYVITDIGYNGKQYEKLEHIDYFLNYNDILRIDFMYYIKLMINPIDDLLNVAFKKNIDNGYKFKKDFLKDQHEFRSKTREKVLNELKNLFRPKLIVEK